MKVVLRKSLLYHIITTNSAFNFRLVLTYTVRNTHTYQDYLQKSNAKQTFVEAKLCGFFFDEFATFHP